MKMLLSTTALVVALGFPTLTLAQTAQTAPESTSAQTTAEMPGFLAMRGQSDVFASELMGHDVYARRAPADMAATSGQATMAPDGTHEMTMMNRTDLDGMDNIGQINEIVLSSDGQVRAIVIGVGGFLGLGEQDVAVTMDQVTFASDPENRTEMYVVVNTGAELLKTSPRYERSAMTGDAVAPADTATAKPADTATAVPADTATTAPAETATAAPAETAAADRTAFVAPKVARDGYNQVEVTEVSAEMLVGKSVYGVNEDSVGTIDDLIVDDKGAITNVIIDFGGFLGMGATQVSVGFEELTILANDGRADVRVYVDATKEQIQAQPPYSAVN